MAMIGNVAIGLTARTAGFTRKMNTARKTLSGLGSASLRMAKSVAKVGAAMGLAAGVGMSLMVKKSMASIDATAKLSDRLGMTTESLQGFRHAAELTGAGSDVMDKSLQKMQKTIGETMSGLGLGKEAFKKLGISIDSIAGKNPAEQFKMIADATANLATQEEKAYVATSIFGRSGQALVNTLSQGRAGINAMEAEAKKLGKTFSRIDAAKIEMANDAITRMKAVWEGISNTLAIEFAPYIQFAADKFTELASSGEGVAARIVNAFKWVAGAIAKVSDYLELPKAGFWMLAEASNSALAKAANAFELVKAGCYSFMAGINDIRGTIADFKTYLAGAFYSIAGNIQQNFGKAFRFIVNLFADVQFQAAKMVNRVARATKQITEQDEVRLNMAARAERNALKESMNSTVTYGAENLQKAKALFEQAQSGVHGDQYRNMAKSNRLDASKSIEAFRTGSAGAQFEKSAELAGRMADKALDRYRTGAAQKETEAWVDKLQGDVQKMAEKIAKSASGETPGDKPGAKGTKQIGGASRGAFFAAEASGLAAVSRASKEEIEQLKTQKEMNETLRRIANNQSAGIPLG